MPVEIGKNTIKLTFLVRDVQNSVGRQSNTEAIPECYSIKRRKPINPRIFGIAHRDQQALLDVIDQLDKEGKTAEIWNRKFIYRTARGLSSALTAFGNSTEF